MRHVKSEAWLFLGFIFMFLGILCTNINIVGFGILFSIGTLFIGIAVYLSTKN